MLSQVADQDIHVFDVNHQKYAFNGKNFNIALLDDVGVSLLNDYATKNWSNAEAPHPQTEIQRFFLPSTPDSNDLFDQENPEAHNPLDILCLLVTSSCNLRCDYCFNCQGSYSILPSQVMSEQTGKNAVDFLLENCGKHAAISFFGGEPVIVFPLIQKLVEYAERTAPGGTSVAFHMATNATLITKKIARYLKRHNFSLIISLDGDQDVHDYHRKFTNGKGSFQSVQRGIENILSVYGSQEQIVFRGTYTHQQQAFSNSFVQMVNRGFQHISIEPATGKEGDRFAVRLGDVPALASEYQKLADSYLQIHPTQPGVSFFHLSGLVKDLVQRQPRNRPCGAANGYVAVAPNGDIYPCHRIVEPQYKLGNVNEGDQIHETDKLVQSLFHNATIPNRENCRTCWAQRLCGGSCYARNVDDGIGILETYATDCELFKMRAELAVGLFVQTELARNSQGSDDLPGSNHFKVINPQSLNHTGAASAEETCSKLREILSCTSCQSSCTSSCTGSCTSGCTDNCTSSCTGGCTGIVMH